VIPRRQFLFLSAAGLGAGAGLGLYAWRIEPHWIEVVRRRLSLPGLPAALEGRTLVQLSDLHIGRRVDDAYLIGALRRVMDLQPDLLVFTGDFLSYHRAVYAQVERVLAHCPRGKLATLGILGNHDYGPGWSHLKIAERLVRMAASVGIEMLRNQVRAVAGLQVVGLDDYWGPRFSPQPALEQLDPARPAIVLSHNPDSVDKPVWGAFRGWILAGHTHGGQCKPPFLPPPLLPVRNKRYTAGEFELEPGRWLYINRGVGHLRRVRLNVRPEITVFRLTGKPPLGKVAS
jgi:hypothetical protein